MITGKRPGRPTLQDAPSRRRAPAGAGLRSPARNALSALLAAAAFAGFGAMSGCASEARSYTPPPGSITDDRAIGDIMVRFTPPAVIVSEDAGKLLAGIAGPYRYVVKRPMSGGVWLVTAISKSADATLEQAATTLRAAPRIETAEPDRMLKPHRTMPNTRDMPPN
ncbi:hypothetical protein [Cupriavidus pampae]|uniref:Lipoprotein n=1 Tax=Cupriavidus pampae TaxID=659251 RepID=A0ABN7YTM4_9BURK|nr:hypothetical protein [Cupriavidus pampae]CAG9176839.1 hypothetical protein LMG32289_03654 [Cupriavidus pampae]